jgi:hypothetical protein
VLQTGKARVKFPMQWFFQFPSSFQPHYGPEINSVSNNLPGSKWRPACKADNLTAICELNVYKTWDPQRLTTPWAPRPVTGAAYLHLRLLHAATFQCPSFHLSNNIYCRAPPLACPQNMLLRTNPCGGGSPASRKRRRRGNTVSDETVMYGYWSSVT